MLITVQPGTPIRLPLHTTFTLDISALLPEGVDDWGAEVGSLLGPWTGLRQVNQTSDGRLTYVPSEDWDGFQAPEGTPEGTPTARLYIYHTAAVGGPIQIDILPSVNRLADPADLRGSAGADTLLFDAGDMEEAAPRLVDTSGGSDVASITNGAGILLGRAGDDRLTGWMRNDALYGGGGNDSLFGGAGDDRLLSMNGDDRVFGGEGGDDLTGDAGNDLLVGGTGNDTLSSGQGLDTLRGEDGNDTLVLGRVVVPTGIDSSGPSAPDPASHTVAYGGNGGDFITTSFGGGLSVGRGGIERVVGSVTLYGGEGSDGISVYNTLGGEIWGGEGDDNLNGSVHASSEARLSLYGGAGNDYVYGGANTDLWGGSGNDNLYVNNTNRASAGDGNDQVYSGWNGSYTDSFLGAGTEIYGGAGLDTLWGGNAADTLHGGADADSLTGNYGDDRLFGGDGADAINGGEGQDWLSGGNGNDTIEAGIEQAYTDEQLATGLTGLADTLVGGAGNDNLSTQRQGHLLYGGSGDDLLSVYDNGSGATDASQLYGGEGNDRLTAGGLATAEGGAGQDVFVMDILSSNGARMIVTDFVRGEDRLDIQSGVGNNPSFFVDYSGQGPWMAIMNVEGPIISWAQVGNDAEIYYDVNYDGTTDATFVLRNTTGLQAQDLGIFDT